MQQPNISQQITSQREENEFLKLKKETRCHYFARQDNIPNSYKDNTLKEELVLEHVTQFKKEFGLTYDSKRELLLNPQNECQIYKFICTTIRPTKVPYPELYDYKKCAKFVSEYFEYEELNPPTRFPEYIPAPDNVVKWQIGDCFDLSIVLCSLLIGAGYNAYVIYGKAPRFITSKDETKLTPPEMPDDIRIIEPDLEDKEDIILPTIEDKKPIYSKFDAEEKAEKEEEARREFIKNTVIDDDMPELERHDPFKDRRIHCWVMIRKCARLDTDHDVFIEPSTGRLYNAKDNCPYEKVDCLFNNVNFYINLHPDKKITEVDWNFNKATNWEYVMLDAKEETDEQVEENKDEDEENEDGSGKPPRQVRVNLQGEDEQKFSEILDMPPPWGNKIKIPLQKYNERSPTTTQVFYYSKTKVERYAPCSQADGLILKIYNYHDYARFILTSVEHRYRNRGDKLYKRIEYPYQHKYINYYLPGQIWHWKQVEEVEASYRKIYFYPTNFQTGIVYREEIFGEKILHKYESRDDKVFERKVLLNKNSDAKQTSYRYFVDTPLHDNKILITKFTQKTNANPLYPPEGQIFKLSYKFDNGTQIQVINHYGKGKILSKPDIFSFEDESSLGSGDKDETAKKMDDDREIWKRLIYANKSKYIEDFKKIEDSYNKNYQASIQFTQRIAEHRDLPAETNKYLYEKGQFELPILEKSIFDIDSLMGEDDLDKDKNDYTGNQQSFDRIAHFLKIQKEKLANGEPQDKIKEDIIKAFKDEKTTVTNVLQKLLKEQVTELQNKIEDFKNKETYGKEEIEKHNIEVNEIQRKINIIYQRSHKHITKIMEELNELLEKMDENFPPNKQ
jgi:hypothetical protein